MTTPLALDMVCVAVASAPGTGTIMLGSPPPFGGVVSFAQGGATDGGTYCYYIQDGNNREFAFGVFSASANSITRNTITASVNGVQQFTPINATANAYVSSILSMTSLQQQLGTITATFASINNTIAANGNGSNVNKFRNGTMDVWQRGIAGATSTTTGAINQTAADGWYVVPTGGTTATLDATLSTPAPGNAINNPWTLSNGNLTGQLNSPSAQGSVTAGSGMSSGKFYMEFTCTFIGSGNGSPFVGIFKSGDNINFFTGGTANSYGYNTNGNLYNNGNNSSYGNTWAQGDIIGVAYDATNGNLWFSKNGVWQHSATIAEIEAGTTTHAAKTGLSGTFYPAIGGIAGVNAILTANFGASAYAFTQPTGFLSLDQPTWAQAAGRSLTAHSLQITGASGVSDILVKQRIEGAFAAPLTSKIVTVQAQVFNNTGASITPTLTIKHANAVDNWSASTTDVNAVNLQSCANASWTQVAYTFVDAGFASNGLEISFDFGNNFSSASQSINIVELDIRVNPGGTTGLTNSPPAPELRPIHTELLLCQRYLPAISGQGPWGTTALVNSAISIDFTGQTSSQTNTYAVTVPFPAPARIAPTGLFVNNDNFAISFGSASLSAFTSTQFVDNIPPPPWGGNAASSYAIFTGAEL